jgi:glucose/arabinose dehydrogenase
MTSIVKSALRGLAVACCIIASGQAQAFSTVSIGSFDAPIDFRAVASQPHLLFVAEKPGRIVLVKNGVKLATPFLDIRAIVRDSGEQGLLSLAFPPDYQTSRRYYVLFVNRKGNVEVDEFRRSATNPLRTAKGSRRVVLVVPHPGASNHNGGQLQFDPQGLLYIAIGDGGNTANPGNPARRLDSLLGKILRIKPIAKGNAAYRIPAGNPFVGRSGRDEIFAYGLRNPWRIALEGKTISIADVGQSAREEVNDLSLASARGANFGWPQYEGDQLYDPTKPGPGTPVPPMFVYDHGGGQCAIMGGLIAHDPQLPTLEGRYLYGDFCTGVLRSFTPDIAAQTAADDAPLGLTISGLTGFGRGLDGQVYIIGGNEVLRLEP